MSNPPTSFGRCKRTATRAFGPRSARHGRTSGDGMTLKLNLLPAAGQDIVVRKAKPKVADQVDEVPY
jgi:hypothetical protein